MFRRICVVFVLLLCMFFAFSCKEDTQQYLDISNNDFQTEEKSYSNTPDHDENIDSQSDDYSTSSSVSATLISNEMFEKVCIGENDSVFFFDDDYVFVINEQYIDENHGSKFIISKLGINDWNNVEFEYILDNALFCYCQPILFENQLFAAFQYPDSSSELVAIDINTGCSKVIYKWIDETITCKMSSSDSMVSLLIVESEEADFINYHLVVFDRTGSIVFQHDEYCTNDIGKSIVSASLIDSFIYVLERDYQNSDYPVYIKVYDTDEEEYMLVSDEIVRFERMEDTLFGSIKDSIFDIFVVNKYLIIETINGRIAVFLIEADNTLSRIDIPESLYDRYPCMYHFVKDLSNESLCKGLYFSDMYNQDNQLFVYDFAEQCTKAYKFCFPDSGVFFIYRNNNGDILIHQRDYQMQEHNLFYLQADNIN